MYQEQRIDTMLNLLNRQEILTTEMMIKQFKVSRDTVRRDFAKLTNEGKVKRVHGGIMRLESEENIFSFNDRIKEFTETKKHIAKLASEFIKPKQTDFFDVSTTVLQLAQMTDVEMTIYTHSLDNSIMLSVKEKVDLHTLGGKFFSKNRFFYSLDEIEILKNINFDVIFVGAAGLKDGQISFDDQEDAQVKKLLLKNAKQKIILAENAKFQKAATYSIGTLDDFDYLITDKKPDQQILSTINVKY